MNWINQTVSLIVISLFSFTILYYWKPDFICKNDSNGKQIIDWYIITLISILLGLGLTACFTLCYVEKSKTPSKQSESFKEANKQDIVTDTKQQATPEILNDSENTTSSSIF